MTDLLDDLHHAAGPVDCLGLTFPNDAARREHFLAILREKLQDPAFRQIEGFPIGSDEDILALSDPPYYTACPNPFITDFIRHYGKPYDPSAPYNREPLAVDVQVGKTDPLYKAHGYHTKVPHLAIVPSVLHYTEPGDMVLDGFCGSGMTGVAAQWCGSAPAVYRARLESEWKTAGREAPKWGARRVVLNDLSPAATFIAANYTLPFDVAAFAKAGKKLLDELAVELGWMYETQHKDGSKGRVEYTVWSEVFSCPSCVGEVVFLDEALDEETKRVRDSFPCPHCGADLNKDRLDRVLESRVDPLTSEPWQRVKFHLSLIAYTVGKARYEKTPDADDLAMLVKIDAMPFPADMPANRFPIEAMYHGSRIAPKGFTHIHHFYLPRAAYVLAALWRKTQSQSDSRLRNMLLFFVEQAIWGLSVLNRYGPLHFSQVNRYLNGVYYVASQHAECSPWYILDGKLGRLVKAFGTHAKYGNSVVSVGSAACLPLPGDSIDYIFTDPPFGENIYYADLNFLVESWHRVITDAQPEAIIDRFKKKDLPEYHVLMRRCFEEYHRVLKPGRWMTVVFSNSRAAVWNSIQVALEQAGFVVAGVSALDKQQGSFRQVTTTTAVKQDLVISAYKPNGGLEERFAKTGGNEKSVWDFVTTHLNYLPTVKLNNGQLDYIAERDPRILFDRMVAWFIRHGCPVPLSSPEFQAGLQERFPVRDGMIFLPEQLNDYDRARLHAAHAPQMELFVSDERSAIDWLTDFLKQRPATYQDIHPDFMQQLGAGWKKHEARPELKPLLEDNFLQDAQDRWYVPDPNQAQQLEQLRTRTLLKEFALYQAHTGRQLKEFRTEALRAGFKAAYDARDYRAIVGVAAKLPDAVLQEDEKLLMYYDVASMRLEEE